MIFSYDGLKRVFSIIKVVIKKGYVDWDSLPVNDAQEAEKIRILKETTEEIEKYVGQERARYLITSMVVGWTFAFLLVLFFFLFILYSLISYGVNHL